MKYLYGKEFVLLGWIGILLSTATCSKNDLPLDIRQESTHFIILTNSKRSTTIEIDQVIAHAETMYDKLSNILGEDRMPVNKITIRMEGAFTGQGPYFNPEGIHLFRYNEEENGYLALLTHEMVHAVREPYYIEQDPYRWPNFGYFDEGFAEYIAQLVEPEKRGFPFYGFDETAVVGDMVLHGNTLSQDTLRNNHEALNQPCNLQTYPLRASWFRFLDKTYGREVLFVFAYPEEKLTSDIAKAVTSADFLTLDQQWEDWIIAKFENTENAGDVAQAFRDRTSWYSYCEQ